MKRKLVSLLLCVAMVATLAAGCGSGSGDSKDSSKEDSKKTEEKKDEGTKEVSTDTVFGKALAQVNEDLAPLPEKDTGKKLAAIESTLTNSFWVTMQEGYEDTAEAVSYTHLIGTDVSCIKCKERYLFFVKNMIEYVLGLNFYAFIGTVRDVYKRQEYVNLK